MLKITPLKDSNKYDALFKSNAYIVCQTCFTAVKYDILSTHTTLECSCHKLFKTWFWIQHNKSNLCYNRCFLISKNPNSNSLTDVEVYDLNNNNKLVLIDREPHSLNSFLKKLKQKRQDYLSSVKDKALKEIEDSYIENKKYLEENLERETLSKIKYLESEFDFNNKKHIVVWDIHNRVSYLSSAIYLAKKYNLELTILWDLLDREIDYWVSNSKMLLELLFNTIENKEIDINLIIGNHDSMLFYIIDNLKDETLHKVYVSWKEHLFTKSELLFMIWTKENNWWTNTLNSFWISPFYNLKDELNNNPEGYFDKFKLYLNNPDNLLIKYYNLLKEKGLVIKELKNKDLIYLVSHHWIPFDKKNKTFSLEIIQEAKDSNTNLEKKVNFICGSLIIKKSKKTAEKGSVIKISYPSNSTFNFLWRKYKDLSKNTLKEMCDKININWVIFWHDNHIWKLNEFVIGLDNTYKDYTYYSFLNQKDSISNSFFTF